MKNGEKPVANPFVVLREEFDDWAVLFDPDTCAGFGLNPTGVYLWKLLDGEHALDDLVEKIRDWADNVPEDASDHARAFVDELVAQGLARYGDKGSYRGKCSHPPLAGLNEVKPFAYEAPRLVNLSSGQAARGVCSGHGSYGGDCCSGAGATGICYSGTCGTASSCDPGTCPTCTGCCQGDSASNGCVLGVWDATACSSGRCVFDVCCNTGSAH